MHFSKNLESIGFITWLFPWRDLTSTAVRRFHEEVPIQAHHCHHFPYSCSMHVCTGDFRIWSLGSFLKMYTSLPGKYTLGHLFLGPLLILFLKCDSKQSHCVGLTFSKPTLKDKACSCVQSLFSRSFRDSSPFSVTSGIFSSPFVPLSFHWSHHSLTVTHLHRRGGVTPEQAVFSSASVQRERILVDLFFVFVCLFFLKHHYHLLLFQLDQFFSTH